MSRTPRQNRTSQRQEWTQAGDIKARLAGRWKKGEFLASHVAATEASLFPVRVRLKRPSSSEMLEHFDDVRTWVQGLEGAEARAPFTLEWTTVDHRQLGRNAVPTAACFADCDSLADFLGERRALVRFRDLAARVTGRFPVLTKWAGAYPFDLLAHSESVDRLLAVVAWLAEHPRPGIYTRQISLPGIDTKFIERHRRILAQWLDLVLPADAVDTRYSGTKRFEARYGFRTRPELLRYRILDNRIPSVGGYSDLTVPVAEFCSRPPGGGESTVTDVFVTENDINGLSLPPRAASIVIFGRGYYFSSLAAATWLHDVRLWYWGDIDTHGFAILNEFRSHFPHTRTVLMDRETFVAHEAHWGTEPTPATGDLPHLTEAERSLYADLRSNRYGSQLRLEQEHIDFDLVVRTLSGMSRADGAGAPDRATM